MRVFGLELNRTVSFIGAVLFDHAKGKEVEFPYTVYVKGKCSFTVSAFATNRSCSILIMWVLSWNLFWF